jgi:hypothetical protein
MELRIPFSKAIKDKRMLAGRWEMLSTAQQVALKSIYGLPLNDSELKIWSAQQGGATYDNLGYITDVNNVPYTPKKRSEAWMICGRRAGKTDRLASTIVAYEALFGGHEAYISRGQYAYCFQISQDLRNAAASLHFIYQTIEDSPVGREMLDGPPVKDEIRLKNKVIIKCIPCTLKASRGFAVPVAVLDEVGVWYTEADSANQDEEVYAAVKKSQIQFPNKLIVGISSPYIKSGLLYRFFEAGTDGRNTTSLDKRHFRNIVVIHAPTPAMGNPLVTKESLEEEYDRDPRAYERECLAVFQDSISGFLTPALIKEATDINVHERPPEPERYNYVAAIDPAFRHDAFAFVIFHLDEEGNVVQDAIRRYKPTPGKALNPKAVLADIAPLLRSYDIVVLYSDQYHLESLQQLVMEYGFLIEGVPFKATNKATIYGSLQQLLNQHRLRLLDNGECLRELRMLEKKLSSGGIVQIHAPQGQYDDLASACALCCYKCLWMSPKPVEEPVKDKSTHDLILDQIRRKKSANHLTAWD